MHPWISRNFGQPIPMTVYEEDLSLMTRNKLIDAFRATFFSVLCSETVFNKK